MSTHPSAFCGHCIAHVLTHAVTYLCTRLPTLWPLQSHTSVQGYPRFDPCSHIHLYKITHVLVLAITYLCTRLPTLWPLQSHTSVQDYPRCGPYDHIRLYKITVGSGRGSHLGQPIHLPERWSPRKEESVCFFCRFNAYVHLVVVLA